MVISVVVEIDVENDVVMFVVASVVELVRFVVGASVLEVVGIEVVDKSVDPSV